MKNDLFTQYLNLLPHEIFDSLIYNYLGQHFSISQRTLAVEKLLAFLQKSEIQHGFIKGLDVYDQQILSLLIVQPLSASTIIDILAFYDAPIIQHHVHTLLERLLIVQNESDLFINPIFLPMLQQHGLHHDLWQASIVHTSPDAFWLTDHHIMMAAIFWQQCQDKWQDLWHTYFPQAQHDYAQFFSIAFTRLQLANTQNHLNYAAWYQLAQLSTPQRLAYFVAAFCITKHDDLTTLAKTLSYVFTHYSQQQCLAGLIQKSYFWAIKQPLSYHAIHNIKLCKIAKYDNHHEIFLHYKQPDASPLILEANLTALYPKDGLFCLPLALAFSLTQYDQFCVFTLTQDSYQNALIAGYDNEQLVADIEKSSAYPVSDVMLTTLQRWQQRSNMAKIYQGFFIELSAEAKQRLEKTGIKLEQYGQWLSNGLLWLYQAPSLQFLSLFEQASLPIPMSMTTPHPPADIQPFNIEYTHMLSNWFMWHPDESYWQELATYSQHIDQQLRIERHIILHKSQLDHLSIQKSHITHGIHFTYKLRLVQQAEQTSQWLAISLYHKNIEKKLIVMVKKIENQGADAILHGINCRTHKVVKIGIKRIMTLSLISPYLI
jgi:hypothetical protein